MTFASRHRPLETYSCALEDAGLLLQRLQEPRTRRDQSRTGRWMRLPLFLHLDALKPATP